MAEPTGPGPLAELRRRLAGLTKMHAIKRHREATGTGWADAARAVEGMRAGRAAETAKGAPPPVSAEARAIGDALGAGNTIEAIRLYRAATGAGLKEAKDAIDAIVAEKRAGPRPRAARIIRRRRLNPIVALLALAALFGTVCGLVILLATGR